MSKVILVTGASRGIGADIVKTLARDGNLVVANYNKSVDEMLKIQQELKLEQKDIEIFKADVSKRQEVKEMVEFVLKKFGKIDVLINNAGIASQELFLNVTEDKWNEIISVNLNSVFHCSQLVLPNMIDNKSGVIINISSVWGVVGASCEVAYSTSKAGIIGLTKALAKELAPSNIRVNAIAPGVIQTDMNKNLNKEEMEKVIEEIPLGRIGYPQNITKCVKLLIENDYITNQIITIDGGFIN